MTRAASDLNWRQFGLSKAYHWHLDDRIVNFIVNLYNNSDSVRTRATDLLDGVMEHGSQQAQEVLESADR